MRILGTVIFFSLLTTGSALAVNYSVELKARLDHAPATGSTTVVEEGSKSVMMLKDTVIELTPTRLKSGLVRVDAQILKPSADGLKVVARPSVVTRLRQPVTISEENNDGSGRIELKMVLKAL
jgi:hypothetical protein